MARYQLTEEDLPFAREFMAAPIGYHSPGLQRVLNRMRGPHGSFKYVLVVKERYGLWQLGRLPARRGAKIELVAGITYTDLIDAERDIFKRRWRDLTGQNLDPYLSQST
ncbi:hypothetical protein [Hoeflea ulvae]|uniref:N,N-dimethylformamidase alpha subunit domain-containing protein n=1 Tax=Hoeflea ulvae TaxID=2983764 RepID=A0ABT3YMT7_9HYPH|nr:hypothetical protein [Hoeflea ulvae]MCY0097035.1 hypothetical protein [Hoeflea ulvae]